MKNLKDIPKTNNFKVPDEYFESFGKKMNERLNDEKTSPKPSAFDVFKPYIYMAASVLILVFLLKTVLNVTVEKSKNISTKNEISEEYKSEDLISELCEDEFTFYEYINEEYTGAFEESEIIRTNEDLAYLEDYLSQYYLEYELLNE